ncbi:MAG: hypothetical protein ACE5H5_06900, partial [Nitrospinota bacterium]
ETVRGLAGVLRDLHGERAVLERHLEGRMKEQAPNVAHLAGPLVGARLKGHGPEAELRLLYSDGLCTMSLFQRPQPLPPRTQGPLATPVTLGEADGRLYRFGLLSMVEWERSPVSFTMVGEVSTDELLATARSIP